MGVRRKGTKETWCLLYLPKTEQERERVRVKREYGLEVDITAKPGDRK